MQQVRAQPAYIQINQNPQYIPAAQVAGMMQAAPATRITGAVPAIGKNSANVAGRQYLQPSQFDRLAESGLYFGLSAGYSTSMLGGIQQDYNDWFVPGATNKADWGKDGSVIPLQLSVGAAINSDVRVDFSYNRYSGMKYPGVVQTSDGGEGAFDVSAYDGEISSSATMLNVFYNIDSYMGNLVGGSLRPYIGVGVGISVNTIADYIVYDPEFYPELTEEQLALAGPGILSGISEISAYHSGGTSEQLSYMLEGGLTTTMDSGMRIDFFVRYMNLGAVQSSGSVVLSQTEWLTDGYGGEMPADYASVLHYSDYKETGNLSSVDVGVRLRVQF